MYPTAKMKAYRDSLPLEHARVKPEVEAQWEADREDALNSKGYSNMQSIKEYLNSLPVCDDELRPEVEEEWRKDEVIDKELTDEEIFKQLGL